MFEYLCGTSNTNVIRLLQEDIPALGGFKVASSAVYLGLWVGPGADKQSWKAQLTKFIERVEAIAAMHAGLWIFIVLCRTLAFSTLLFATQARRVPLRALAAEKKAIFTLARGPRLGRDSWLPLDAAFNLDLLYRFPGCFPL